MQPVSVGPDCSLSVLACVFGWFAQKGSVGSVYSIVWHDVSLSLSLSILYLISFFTLQRIVPLMELYVGVLTSL